MRKTLIAIMPLLLCSTVASSLAQTAASAPPATSGTSLYPNLTLALPVKSQISVRWVLPPSATPATGNNLPIAFDVDAQGHPWLYSGTNLVDPLGGHFLSVNLPLQQITFLENGALLAAAATLRGSSEKLNNAYGELAREMINRPSDIGALLLPARLDAKDNRVGLLYQPLLRAPFATFTLSAGSSQALYLFGEGKETGAYQVLLLQPESLRNGTAAVTRGYRRVLSSDQPISAVTGDGQTTYFASGEKILVSITGEPEPKLVYASEDKEPIVSLAGNIDTGLFYSTTGGVGYVGRNGAVPLLASGSKESLQLRLRGTSLYIFCPESDGVLALDHVDELRSLPLGVARVAATEGSKVAVSSVTFSDGVAQVGEPAVINSDTASKVNVWVTLANVSAETKNSVAVREQVVIRHDTALISRSLGHCEFNIGASPRICEATYSNRSSHKLYPGGYSVDITVDGIRVATRHFTITGTPSITEAAEVIDPITLKKALDNGGEPNGLDKSSRPLHAVLGQNFDGIDSNVAVPAMTNVLQMLLEHGADVNARDSRGDTPLLLALRKSPSAPPAIIELLIAKGADVNASGSDGKTPFLLAFDNAPPETIKLLIDKGANLNVRDRESYTPLIRALAPPVAPPEIVRLLIDKGADVNAHEGIGCTPLIMAVSFAAPPEIIKLLLDKGAGVDTRPETNGNTPLMFALIYSAPPEVIKLLLDRGADANARNSDGDTPLSIAFKQNNPRAALLLLEAHASTPPNATVENLNGKRVSLPAAAIDSGDPKQPLNGLESRLFIEFLKRGCNLLPGEENLVAAHLSLFSSSQLDDVLTRVPAVMPKALSPSSDLSPDDPKYAVIARHAILLAREAASKATSLNDLKDAAKLLDQVAGRYSSKGISGPAELYYDLGMIDFKLGNGGEAATRFNQYLALAPDASDAKEVRSLIAQCGK